MKKMLFIGGDKRMLYAAKRLRGRFICHLCCVGEALPAGFSDMELVVFPPKEDLYDFAVLPLPASRDGVNIYCPLGGEAMLSLPARCVKSGGTVFTSKDFPALSEYCEKRGISVINYFGREELAVLNAVPSAEGALAAAITELPVMINGLHVLVLGFGRIGKLTARYFAALGAKVAVSARKPADLAWIKALGLYPVDFRDRGGFSEALAGAELILNTVPQPILDGYADSLKTAASPDFQKTLIELASSPCISEAEAAKSGLRVIPAGGLPGKLAPVSAGEIIADTVMNIINETWEREQPLPIHEKGALKNELT